MMAYLVKNRGKLALAAAAAGYCVLGLVTGDMEPTAAAVKFIALVTSLGLF